ncbi:MAG: 50S ribosomal protein L4 [Candidatus Bipolaricaulaceae bacterium]
MPKAKLYQFADLDAPPQEVELPAAAFGQPVNRDLLYRAVRVELANRRQGTAQAKSKAQVSGGGRKPWRQKGTGRARHGSIRSPLWRHGGVIFGPRAGSTRLALPKRMRRQALACALSARLAEGELRLVDALAFPRPRTKDGLALLEKLGCTDKTLVVVAPQEYGLAVVRSFSNLPGVTCVRSDALTPYRVVEHPQLVLTQAAAQQLAERVDHGR